jgi:hypothetical protein
MSWSRAHLETMTELQLKIQRMVEEAGIEAAGVDNLVESNELLAETQACALRQIEKREEALVWAEALRPFCTGEK